jgi:hypothetical protein
MFKIYKEDKLDVQFAVVRTEKLDLAKVSNDVLKGNIE